MDTFFIIFCVVAVLILGFFVMVKTQAKAFNWVINAVPDAHKSIDQIIDDKHWLGENLVYLHSQEPEPVSASEVKYKVWYADQLCKSKSGNYLLLRVLYDWNRKRIDIQEITPLSLDDAKRWSQSYFDFYSKEFGKPKVA